LVDGDIAVFSGFFLPDDEGFSGQEIFDHADGDSGQVGGAKVGVNAEGKQAEVFRGVGEQGFHAVDLLDGLEGVYLDDRTFCGPVIGPHGFS